MLQTSSDPESDGASSTTPRRYPPAHSRNLARETDDPVCYTPIGSRCLFRRADVRPAVAALLSGCSNQVATAGSRASDVRERRESRMIEVVPEICLSATFRRRNALMTPGAGPPQPDRNPRSQAPNSEQLQRSKNLRQNGRDRSRPPPRSRSARGRGRVLSEISGGTQRETNQKVVVD
jgi:hypothetical protein